MALETAQDCSVTGNAGASARALTELSSNGSSRGEGAAKSSDFTTNVKRSQSNGEEPRQNVRLMFEEK